MKLSQKYILIILLSIFIFPVSFLGVNFLYYTVITQLGNLSSEEFYTSDEVKKNWDISMHSLKGRSDGTVKSKLENKAERYPQSMILWISDEGKLLASIGKTKGLNKEWNTSRTIQFITEQQGKNFTTQSYLNGAEHSGYVFLQIPESQMGSRWDVMRNRYAYIWFIALGLIWFLFVFISWLFFKRISNRLIKMQKSMEIKNQLVPPKIKVEKHDEIGQLENSFNRMVDQLHESHQKEKNEETIRRRLVASLSHDLRTPLSVINGHTHKINRYESRPEVKESLTLINEKVDFIAGLIDNLTSFTVLQEGKLPMNKQPTDIVNVVRSSLIAYYPILEELGFEIHVDLDQSAQWNIDETWLRRILDNIFQNVKRHAVSGKYLSVCTIEKEGVTSLKIEDHGPGMGNNTEQKGAGIGLSIVDMMLEQMGLGKSVYDSSSGTTIIISPERN